mmetsp:Transcript_18954/g.65140  ORF Transcript_18954/g.65140 Transcript_18954/m.65140 type:complete len:226 (+) Transcript_18954:261-938(+)
MTSSVSSVTHAGVCAGWRSAPWKWRGFASHGCSLLMAESVFAPICQNKLNDSMWLAYHSAHSRTTSSSRASTFMALTMNSNSSSSPPPSSPPSSSSSPNQRCSSTRARLLCAAAIVGRMSRQRPYSATAASRRPCSSNALARLKHTVPSLSLSALASCNADTARSSRSPAAESPAAESVSGAGPPSGAAPSVSASRRSACQARRAVPRLVKGSSSWRSESAMAEW